MPASSVQGGAYATGVLVLMGSAALAVTLAAWREGNAGLGYLLLTVIFVYTTVVNIVERPEGIKIASFFIVTIIVTSLVSRVLRSTELRVQGIEADELAALFLRETGDAPLRIIANRPGYRAAVRVPGQAARSAGLTPPSAR